MGFGMAKNIRKKISPESSLVIFDINHDAMDRFVKEFDDNNNKKLKIVQAKSPKEVAEVAVCCGRTYRNWPCFAFSFSFFGSKSQ